MAASRQHTDWPGVKLVLSKQHTDWPVKDAFSRQHADWPGAKLALSRQHTDLPSAVISVPHNHSDIEDKRSWSFPISGRMTSEMTLAIRRQSDTNNVKYWTRNDRPRTCTPFLSVKKHFNAKQTCKSGFSQPRFQTEIGRYKNSFIPTFERHKWKARNKTPSENTSCALTDLPSNLTCLQFTNCLFSTPIVPPSFGIPTPLRYMDILEQSIKLNEQKETNGLSDDLMKKCSSKFKCSNFSSMHVMGNTSTVTDTLKEVRTNIDNKLSQDVAKETESEPFLHGRSNSLPVMQQLVRHRVQDRDSREELDFINKMVQCSIDDKDEFNDETDRQIQSENIVVIETVTCINRRPPILKNGRKTDTITENNEYYISPSSCRKQDSNKISRLPHTPVTLSAQICDLKSAPLQVSSCSLSKVYPRNNGKLRSVRFKVCNEVIEFTQTKPVCS